MKSKVNTIFSYKYHQRGVTYLSFISDGNPLYTDIYINNILSRSKIHLQNCIKCKRLYQIEFFYLYLVNYCRGNVSTNKYFRKNCMKKKDFHYNIQNKYLPSTYILTVDF